MSCTTSVERTLLNRSPELLAPHKRLTDERKQNWQPQNKWKTEKCHVRVQAHGCPIFTLVVQSYYYYYYYYYYYWSNMIIRVDKCSTFGIRKLCTKSVQYLPKLLINGVLIPCVEMGESFRYLGRFFDFNMSKQPTHVWIVLSCARLDE